ncbi:hypothetical protein AVJ23_20045 [Pseudoponticoccus marisrubri]|uniref:Uncharacterized protein n=1 Tax=Pseudoponticoccus marisrubri TaxID=1685382 RepID=A0A0W7WES8_9RHOB|nr:hypothetical protein AVJ23_20045 [Pseudoponticoccus marisrubri]
MTNLAVGANSCLDGLARAKSADLSGVDVTVIEYAINDRMLLSYCGEETWLNAYEGLVRHLRREYPKMHVLPLILGRRGKNFFADQDVMRTGIMALARRYTLPVVDFDALMHRELPRFEEFKTIYRDGAHYLPPLIPSHLATMVAGAIAQCLLRGRPLEVPLPEPVGTGPFDDAQVMPLDALAPGELARERFENSRFQADAVFLPVGTHLDLGQEAGTPISVGYVSDRRSCDMVIETAGHRMRLHTQHELIATGEFEFLLRTTLPRRRHAAHLKGGPIRIHALHADQLGPGSDEFQKGYKMLANRSDGPQGLSLVRILRRL